MNYYPQSVFNYQIKYGCLSNLHILHIDQEYVFIGIDAIITPSSCKIYTEMMQESII